MLLNEQFEREPFVMVTVRTVIFNKSCRYKSLFKKMNRFKIMPKQTS